MTEYPYLLVVVLTALMAADTITTMRALALGAYEMNPIVAAILKMRHGRFYFMAIKVGYGAAILAFYDYIPEGIFLFLCVVYFCVVVWNLMVIRGCRVEKSK